MIDKWTFGRVFSAGVIIVSTLVAVVGVVGLVALHNVANWKDQVINRDLRLVVVAKTLEAAVYDREAAVSGYLASTDAIYLERVTNAENIFDSALDEAAALVHTEHGRQLVDAMRDQETELRGAVHGELQARRTGRSLPDSLAAQQANAAPIRARLIENLTAFRAREQGLADLGTTASNVRTRDVTGMLITVFALLVVGTSTAGFRLTRRLERRIRDTVAAVRHSSTDLQVTANQQAASAQVQASAMTEITTTIVHLQQSSRHIADSARQVSEIAERTAHAGHAGEETMRDARASMTDIRRQVDVIVTQMMELGEESRRMGGVLDILSTLAEETHVLAARSEAEALEAGPADRRFALVAQEIRHLSDRVADSTHDVRHLIDTIRGSVGTTVAAARAGAQAVTAGARNFDDATFAFTEICTLVRTTTDAAREIERSTLLQATAVEQVTQAVTQVTRASHEAEDATSHTSDTADHLADLSQDLLHLVQAPGRVTSADLAEV